jgi:SnoaL-like domain
MTSQDSKVLWDRWIELWNGDLTLVQEIIHPDLEIHRIPPPRISDHLRGREALLAWIKQTRSLFADLRLRVEVGPIVDGVAVAGRWVA